MHYIKDIFENNPSEHAHNKFIRYSKGIFVGPLLQIKFAKNQIKVSGSFHFIDELLYLITEIIGNRVVHINGTLVWNSDLSTELAKLGIKYSKVTKARGIFKYILDNDVHFKDFVEAFAKYNILVSVKTDEVSLVTKSSFPKPNKEFTSDFCKAIFPGDFAKRIKEEFAFDIKEKNPKQINIKHQILINDIILPHEDNFDEARRLAKRVGLLKRFVIVDGQEEIVTQKDLNV